MAGGAEVVIRATCSRRLAARFGYVVAMKDQRIGCGRGWSELARRDAAGEKSPVQTSCLSKGSWVGHRSSQYLPFSS
jgi:hypothetical protein